MDKLISEICSHMDIENSRTKAILFNSIGFLVVGILFISLFFVFGHLQQYPKIIGAETHISFFKLYYAIDKFIGLLICLLSFYLIIKAIKYVFSLIIECIKFFRIPKYNDLDHSIQSLMTPLVDDDGFGLHYEILRYLYKNKTARDFAIVHLWLYNNSFIYTKEQKAFLDALSADDKIISVPALSSLNEAESEVSFWLKKEESSLSIEEYNYVKRYKVFDIIFGKFKIKNESCRI